VSDSRRSASSFLQYSIVNADSEENTGTEVSATSATSDSLRFRVGDDNDNDDDDAEGDADVTDDDDDTVSLESSPLFFSDSDTGSPSETFSMIFLIQKSFEMQNYTPCGGGHQIGP